LKIAILLPLKIVISLPRSAFSQRMRSWFASGATGIGLALKTPSLNGAGPQGLKLTMTGRTVSRHRAAISARRAPRTMMPQDDDVERLGSTLDLSGPRQRTVSPGICVARYLCRQVSTRAVLEPDGFERKQELAIWRGKRRRRACRCGGPKYSDRSDNAA
jgi:hypothetical protein